MQSAYLETTVIGNVAGRAHPDPVVAARQTVTRRWWAGFWVETVPLPGNTSLVARWPATRSRVRETGQSDTSHSKHFGDPIVFAHGENCLQWRRE